MHKIFIFQEPQTFSVGVCHSIQLSYRHMASGFPGTRMVLYHTFFHLASASPEKAESQARPCLIPKLKTAPG